MSFFGLDKPSPHSEDLELLTTVYDNVALAVIESLLRGEGIPYMIKERGVGSAVKIISGLSSFGTDIFVKKELYETAKELLEATPEGEETENEVENE